MAKYHKGEVVWQKGMARVWRNADGGVAYDYLATQTGGSPRCTFTMFCEVGEPYRERFDGFFKKFRIVGKVDYGDEKPYYADKVERIPK
jgi:hypothetical protein